jgi:hypothetical protein
MAKSKLVVQNIEINITPVHNHDFICLTDMPKKAKAELPTSLKTGCATGTHWNFQAPGSKFIIPVLKWSNLTTLKRRQVCPVLF